MIRGGVRVGIFVVGVLLVLTVVLRVWEWSQVGRLDAQLDELVTYRPPTEVRVLGQDGEPIDSFGVERRTWMDLEAMSPWLPKALLAAEDRRFRYHTGVDPFGIARAMVSNARAGTITQGGSTLTQQLVKSLVVGSDRTYTRKLEEALLARRLERRIDKDTILELYLNQAYFGAGNYGVEAAAQDTFGRSASTLDAGQAALLIALIPAPSAWSPRRDLVKATRQRARVLGDLVETGALSREEAERLSTLPIDPPRRQAEPGQAADSYRTVVRREIRRLLADTTQQGELVVHTPYDDAIQRAAEQSVRQAVEDLEQRQGTLVARSVLRGRTERRAFLELAEGLERGADGSPMVPAVGTCFPAMKTADWRPLRAGPYEIPLTRESWKKKIRSGSAEQRAGSVGTAPWGTVLDVCMGVEGAELVDGRWVEGAAVVIDNKTGGVVALVGGRDVALEGFIHATQAPRQPGSTFKPYVYGAALEQGSTQLTKVVDGPIRIGGWAPTNAGGSSLGPVTLRTALTYSLNTVAVRLGVQTGVPEIQELAHRAGVRSPLADNLTLALGSSEVTVIEHATGYATIARGGLHTEPVLLTSVARDGVVTRAGEMLEVNGESVRLPGPDGSRVIDEAVTAQLVDMLRRVVEKGTGRRAYDPTHDRAGKTGTTSDHVDGWFVGFVPNYTVAVWVGAGEGAVSLGPGEYASRSALPAWLGIVESLGDRAGERFEDAPATRLTRWGSELVVVPRAVRQLEVPEVLPSFVSAQ